MSLRLKNKNKKIRRRRSVTVGDDKATGPIPAANLRFPVSGDHRGHLGIYTSYSAGIFLQQKLTGSVHLVSDVTRTELLSSREGVFDRLPTCLFRSPGAFWLVVSGLISCIHLRL